ncbi:MAG TPA: hypothetical protein VMR70_14735 [Flavisolibacter sp.]|nr:hypothetical protein [Flavisolibacter sp.]
MTLEEFNQLNYEGQLQATQKAVCIAGREENKFKVLLFQLNDFYIEVYYNARLHFISQLVPFRSTDYLQPYLEKIPVHC